MVFVVTTAKRNTTRSTKDEDKPMEPMFPKLHLSDAERKGGPRAPPRNKMAISDHHLSSERLISASSSPVKHGFEEDLSRLRDDPERPRNKMAISDHHHPAERLTSASSSPLKHGFEEDLSRVRDDPEREKAKRKREDLEMEDQSDRKDENSEDSMVESVSGFDLSPEDAVGMMGDKQFWKARMIIRHQQKIFSMQVFELHRLIKVQRIIAGLPEGFFEDDSCKFSIVDPKSETSMPNEVTAESPTMMLPPPPLNSDVAAESPVIRLPPPPLDSDPVESETAKPNDDDAESLVIRLPPLPLNSDPVKTPRDEPVSSSTEAKPPPGNLRVVPIRSPTDGIIYKAYVQPYTPTAGFKVPVNAIPGPSRLDLAYYSPYNKRLRATPGGNSKYNDSQGSSENSPSDELSLVPTENSSSDPQFQVIKVVPYNRRTSSESVARILRSIQEDQKKTGKFC